MRFLRLYEPQPRQDRMSSMRNAHESDCSSRRSNPQFGVYNSTKCACAGIRVAFLAPSPSFEPTRLQNQHFHGSTSPIRNSTLFDQWNQIPRKDRAKRAAGVQAIATYLKNGMKIGLGSGTTWRWFIQTLGDRVKEGLEVIGVPTSNSTRDLATQLGVPRPT
jgi:hypothetical protein